MLGIRLDPETERALERVARRSGRPKSQIAREAIVRHLARDDSEARARAEWAEVSRAERDDAEMKGMLDHAMRELDPNA